MHMRVYVKISDSLGEKLERYAKEFGMSKSGFVAYALGNHIHTLDYQSDIYSNIKAKTLENIDSMANDKGDFSENI